MKYTDEEISRAARELHREWESPQLWPRIQAALAAEAARAERSRALHVRGWLSLAAAAAVLVFGVSVLLRARAPLPGVQRCHPFAHAGTWENAGPAKHCRCGRFAIAATALSSSSSTGP